MVSKAVCVCSSSVWWSSDLDSYVPPCNSDVNSNLTALEGERQEEVGESVFAGTAGDMCVYEYLSVLVDLNVEKKKT